MTVTVRYPGRICLLGEHCDWAGGGSLVVPLPLGITARAEAGGDGLQVEAALEGELLVRRLPAAGEVDPAGGALRLVAAAAAALAARGLGPPGAHLRLSSDLPAGRGFSSSAAVTLASLDTLARLAGHTLADGELAELAFHVEHELLGVACGRLDPLACAAAQPLYIRWVPDTRGDHRPALRRIEPRGRFHLVAGSFPRPRDTPGILSTLQSAWWGDLRDAVAAERARAVRTALDTFADAAATGARALLDGDAPALGACLDQAQHAYEDELADTFAALRAPALWRTCQELRGHGALGAKFSGAGGDGSVIALLPDAPSARAAVDLLEVRGLAAWYCPFGQEA